MKPPLLISDSGPIISLALLDQLELLTRLFDDVRIPSAVWEELTEIRFSHDFSKIAAFFQSRVIKIERENYLFPLAVDYGESEAMLLYKQMQATCLLIDDKKARMVVEELGIVCIGTLGLLYRAKERGVIGELRPLFVTLLRNNRYYAISILNAILEKAQESLIVM